MAYRHYLSFYELFKGLSAQMSSEESLSFMSERVGGTGGVIVLDKMGNIGKHFTTERMAWASLQDEELHYGINPGDDVIEVFK